MKVCVLQPSYKDSKLSAIAHLDFARDLSPWMPREELNITEVEHVFLDKATVVQQILQVKADVFVNLCDGAWDEDTPGIDVVQTLEANKLAFTGAHSAVYDPSKETMKKICMYWGVKTPVYFFAYTPEDVELAINVVPFPCFVKHHHGCNSVGITKESRADTPDELRRVAHRMIEQFGGALIEQFVDGREFSVLVASDPNNDKDLIVYDPVECLFDDEPEGVNFKTFDFKWKGGAKNPWVSVYDTGLPPNKIQEMQDMTKTVFLALGGQGYARSDIRMDKNTGELYFLEINPNCSVFYPDDNGATADLILMYHRGDDKNTAVGGKRGFLKSIIEYALQRKKRKEKNYIVRYDERMKGFGMFAARDIAAGEMIYQLEESAHFLVSRARVERDWTPKYKEFFTHFCYPITDDLFVMWDINPENWKPINHSCDPNAWVTGLDLYARREIRRGEQITMDYATMYTTDHMQFQCMCGSELCRGSWRGDDYLQDWFQERYGDHVTDYVMQKRKVNQLIENVRREQQQQQQQQHQK